MSDYPPSNKLISHLMAVLSVLTAFSLFSCADSTPELAGTTSAVIFEYDDLKKNPSMRLAAFVEVRSEARRVETISIYSRKAKMEWTTDEPLVFADEKRQWAGYSDFSCADGYTIPSGFYDLSYTDAEGRLIQTVFSVSYNEKLSTTKGESFLNLYKSESKEKIALFSDQNMLLYFGDKKTGWKEDSAIFKSNSECAYYRSCYSMNNDTVIVLMPKVLKK